MKTWLTLTLVVAALSLTAPSASAHCPAAVTFRGAATDGSAAWQVEIVRTTVADVPVYTIMLHPVGAGEHIHATVAATDDLECELFPLLVDYHAESTDAAVEFHLDGKAESSHVVAEGHFEGIDLAVAS